MIRRYIITILLCFVLALSGCDLLFPPAPTSTPSENISQPEITQVPLATPVPTATLPPATTVITATPPPATTQPQYTMPPTTNPSPPNTMEFYSCYAHMVSYNPANAWAEFDYFYLHQGQDAIDYLVDYEGYSVTDAENLVNGFADSEFVEQNNNPGLRTIDLDLVDVRTIVNMDGSVGPDLIGSIVTTTHLNNLYSANPSNLVDYFFYFVECDSNGNVIEVRQVFWP